MYRANNRKIQDMEAPLPTQATMTIQTAMVWVKEAMRNLCLTIALIRPRIAHERATQSDWRRKNTLLAEQRRNGNGAERIY